MNITIITSETLEEFPPVITLLKTLDQFGHNLTFIAPYRDISFKNLRLVGAEHRYITERPMKWMKQYYSSRIKASAAFHSERLLRRMFIKQIPKKYKNEIQAADIVWILHENTMIFGGKYFINHLGPYLYTMYELCIKNEKLSRIYDCAAHEALLTVVPEYCRAHIVKAYYRLVKMPEILPNKPLEHPKTRNMAITDSEIAAKISQLKDSGKKIIMYMGILSSERPLEPLVEAANSSKDYVLAVLGGRTPYLDRLQQKMGDRFVYLGAVKPPYHLEIASHADIAYISYVPNNSSINAVFCAPNKVYEFAGFGIPMLCNDNPGLKYTVEYNRMGVCVPELSTEEILLALKNIDTHYCEMSRAAIRYYEEESVENAVQRILERYLSLKKEIQS